MFHLNNISKNIKDSESSTDNLNTAENTAEADLHELQNLDSQINKYRNSQQNEDIASALYLKLIKGIVNQANKIPNLLSDKSSYSVVQNKLQTIVKKINDCAMHIRNMLQLNAYGVTDRQLMHELKPVFTLLDFICATSISLIPIYHDKKEKIAMIIDAANGLLLFFEKVCE